MRVIGTAGHVDHGKSTLVKALTGIEPDRLKEEQQRAMTIDLGFAWLKLASGEDVGIVDVPGHQDFIKNMLAGVGGIDAALFVIAADEGVMPQTREHLAILDLLEIPRGIIVITKSDTIEDEDWLELVQADVSETVAGTVLADAPMIPVSALSGQGLDELRRTLDSVLSEAPPRTNRGRPRLPVDRVFSISGFGTVVTGTLLDGQLEAGQDVEILPKSIVSRIRGLQFHKKSVDIAQPGARTAVNLTGVNANDVSRGDVLTTPGWLEPSQLIDVHLKLLSDAPKELRHNQQVEIFTGSTEVSGFTRLLGARQIEPGQTGWVQLRLQHRIPVIKGDHFIIRQPSPSITIGGGVVVDPLPRRRHKRFRTELIDRLETLLAGTPEDILLAELDQKGPLMTRAIIGESSLPTDIATSALSNLIEQNDVFSLLEVSLPDNLAQSKVLMISQVGWATLIGQIKMALGDYHSRFPLRLGMPRSELKSQLKLETRVFNETVQRAQLDEALDATETSVRLISHQVEFSVEQQKAIFNVLTRFEKNPYSTPSPKELIDTLGDDVFLALLESKQIIRLSKDVLLLSNTYNEFVAWLKEYLREQSTINVAQVRDVFKTSRKYALALLEYTDEQRITKRVGDNRVLR